MGGSRFVSYQIAKYFSDLYEEVYILNRGNFNDLSRLNVTYLKADRHDLKQLQRVLNNLYFDIIIDVSCYQESDVDLLLKFLTQMPKCYI